VVSVAGLLKNVQDLKFLWNNQKADFFIWTVCALATVIFGLVSCDMGRYLQGAYRFVQTAVLNEFHKEVSWFLSRQRENLFHFKNILEFITRIDWYLVVNVQKLYSASDETSLNIECTQCKKQKIFHECHPN